MKLMNAALTFAGVIIAAATSVSVPVTAQIATAASVTQACHPLTNGGKCYKPGEFCRHTDHDAIGLAGNGEIIACWDNHGWRWEPVIGVKLTCAVTAGGPTGWKFRVTATVPEREFLGSFHASFGAGETGVLVTSDKYASPAQPYRATVAVPAVDVTASAHPSHCTVTI